MCKTVYSNYRWIVIGALCVVQAITVAVLVAPATLIGNISGDIGLSLGMTTGATMVFHNLFLTVSAIFGGILIDRFGPFRVWSGGMALFALGFFLVPVFGGSVYGILAIRALHGIGAGPVMATAPVVVAQWSPLKQRGVLIGIQGAFVSLGSALSMIFVPFMCEATGSWQLALAGVGGLALAALFLSLAMVRGPDPPAEFTTGATQPREATFVKPKPLAGLYRLPATWSAVLCGFWFSWTIRIIYDIIPGYLAMETPIGIGMGALQAGRTMAVAHIFSIIGVLASGLLVEKLFKGRPRGLVTIGFFFGAILWLSIGFPELFPNQTLISLCVWIGGMMVSFTFPMVLTFVSKCYPEHVMGKISGLITGFSTIGTLVGLAAGTYALQLTGIYSVTTVFISAGAFLGSLSALFLKEPRWENHASTPRNRAQE